MKHYTMCVECDESNPQDIVWASGELTNELYAICTCQQGHKTLSSLTHHAPDIIFMSAVRAFRYECYSESVLSFTAALERTFEIFFKAFWIKQEIKQEIKFDILDEMWKEMKKQSERQYGAFCLAYCVITKTAWKTDNNKTEFRNKVVHQGYIASKSETLKYAEYITEKLDTIISVLNSELEEECKKLNFHNQKSRSCQKLLDDNPDLKFCASGLPSLLCWNHSDRSTITFDDVLKKAEEIEKILVF